MPAERLHIRAYSHKVIDFPFEISRSLAPSHCVMGDFILCERRGRIWYVLYVCSRVAAIYISIYIYILAYTNKIWRK